MTSAPSAIRPSWGVAIASAMVATVALPALVVVGAVMGARSIAAPSGEVPGIPPSYVALYHAAAERYELGEQGWSILAAVGEFECDHGRSPLPGCHRGEANSAGARGPAQFLPATWAVYGVDADGDGDRDVYDPTDAVFGMANYLRTSGGPHDWRSALFAYNHAGWYVDRVLRLAAAYRGGAAAPGSGWVISGSRVWLVSLPGFPGERCDARIVPDVVELVRAFRIHVSDCYGGAPHAHKGEHPLGLAIDASPVDGDWRRTEALRHFGWSERCAKAGCPGAGPFRVVLYNGFPGHGDPSHSTRPHIHLSWQHGPAAPHTRAPWVRVVTSASATDGPR
jgi:hypothetical protein